MDAPPPPSKQEMRTTDGAGLPAADAAAEIERYQPVAGIQDQPELPEELTNLEDG
jgi:hypothetical protein